VTPLLSALFFAIAPTALQPLIDLTVPNPQTEYLLIDVHTREVLASRWPGADIPIPVGSLVKPFTALAYNGDFPEFECKGAQDRCWLKRGHGRLNFTQALAQSCNSYFLQLAQRVDTHALQTVTAKYSLSSPAVDSPETRIGLGTGWQISPLALTRAYAELSLRGGEPAVAQILRGLEESARVGTSAAIGPGALAKTGTAPCTSKLHHVGDGFTLVLDPANAPRIALLVRVHNVPGAEAAKTAARILMIVRTGK
jgi:cell division protein FtsI/penicillin-binding protein 2